MKGILVTAFALLCMAPVYSQNTGTIKGIVVENGTPIEFANVFVKAENDTLKITSGTVTDSLGRFQLHSLPLQRYVLVIQLIGFRKKQISVVLTSTNQSVT